MKKNTIPQLGERYPLVDIQQARTTRELILLESTVLFARHGYAAVSMRDIARKAGMQVSSLYTHFSNKEALWDAVLTHIKNLYLLYFDRLTAALRRTENYAQTVQCMFVELKEIVHIFTYYGFSLIQTEQFRDPKAYQIYRDILLKYSIETLEYEFNLCIEKGWAKPFDTRIVAAFFMHSVLIGIQLRAHRDMERSLPYDVDQMFEDLQTFIYAQGKL